MEKRASGLPPIMKRGRSSWMVAEESARPLPQHPFALRVEPRRRLQARRAAVAEDFDLEAAVGLLQLRRHVAHRDRAVGPVGLAAGGHPADYLDVVPDTFVAHQVGAPLPVTGRLDDEGA